LGLRLFLATAAALLAGAAPASAEVQRPDETAYINLRTRQGFELVVGLYPKRNVAVLHVAKGMPEEKGSRWTGAAYAIHPPARAFEGGIDLRFGGLATVRGHFVPNGPAEAGRHNRFCEGRAPISESGQFRGRIAFRGEDGYLKVDAGRAAEHITRSFKLRCERGHAAKFQNRIPGLFGYIESSAGAFSNRDGTILAARTREDRRIIEFFALHHLFEQSSSFKAATLEWLPGEIAAMRWAEVWRVAVETFTVTPPEEHPASAVVRPPAPFSGEATYSRASHSLEGNLRVAFPGLELPLASPPAEAGTCAFTRRMLERVCDFS
jgi:hypothetical protein